MSDTAPDGLNDCDLLCVVKASIVIVRVVTTESRNRLVLRGQLYIVDCKDEGNMLKPHLPGKKTVHWNEDCTLE